MATYQPTKRHPLALTLILAGHGAVLTALALSKMEVPVIEPIIRTTVEHINAPKPPPPPAPPKQSETKPSQTPSVIDRSPLPIPSPNQVRPAPPTPAPPPVPIPEVPVGNATVLPPPPVPVPTPLPQPAPAPDPVHVAASRDPRYADDFQPPYPDNMRAQGEEGRAVVRVLVGTNGRVLSVEPVEATHSAFMNATTRHARARWRFRPATVDGRPVEGWKRVTVTFTLND